MPGYKSFWLHYYSMKPTHSHLLTHWHVPLWNVVSDKTGLVSVSNHHGRYDGEKSSASLTTFQVYHLFRDVPIPPDHRFLFLNSRFQSDTVLTPKRCKALQFWACWLMPCSAWQRHRWRSGADGAAAELCGPWGSLRWCWKNPPNKQKTTVVITVWTYHQGTTS